MSSTRLENHDRISLGSAESGAEFSDCMRWRYKLWRNWKTTGKGRIAVFCGLNPSTADAVVNDPTVTRCIRFAQKWKYTGMIMLNAYAFRATDPDVMVAAPEPVGRHNDDAIAACTNSGHLFVVAWGGSLSPKQRRQVGWDERIAKILTLTKLTPHCLGVTKDGSPRHPLYMRSDSKPRVWRSTHG